MILIAKIIVGICYILAFGAFFNLVQVMWQVIWGQERIMLILGLVSLLIGAGVHWQIHLRSKKREP